MKILIIPHAPAAKIRTRALEFAIALGKLGHEVDLYGYNVNERQGFFRKVIWHIKEASPWVRKKRTSYLNVSKVSLPTLHYGPLFLKKLLFPFSSFLFYLKPYEIVFNASFERISIIKKRNLILVYDFVDDHSYDFKEIGISKKSKAIRSFIHSEMKKSDFILCSSLVLQEVCKRNYNINAYYSPNATKANTIKKEQRTISEKKNVIRLGYVGGLDRWVSFGPVIEAIEKLRLEGEKIELHIVGRGDALNNTTFSEWFYFHGFKEPDEIPRFLKSLDIGILPFEVSPFTDAALPLKVLEYGAANLLTIASPIKELTLQKLPWVILSDLSCDAWIDSIKKASRSDWNSEWDQVVNKFDWDTVVHEALQYITEKTTKS